MIINNKTNWIRWTARIWSIPVIAFILIFAIGYLYNWITTGIADPYAVESYPFVENLPPIFLAIAGLSLLVAWWKEKWGGFINIVFCLITLPILIIYWPISQNIRNIVPYILLLIVLIPGILFSIIGFNKNK